MVIEKSTSVSRHSLTKSLTIDDAALVLSGLSECNYKLESTTATLILGNKRKFCPLYTRRDQREILEPMVEKAIEIQNAMTEALKRNDPSLRLDFRGEVEFNGKREPDPNTSTITKASIVDWCDKKGIDPSPIAKTIDDDTSDVQAGFGGRTAEYLNKDHPRYSQELHIAIEVWEYFKDRKVTNKSPKQAIEEWLKERNRNLTPQLSDESKKRIATMVNWKKRGGNIKIGN